MKPIDLTPEEIAMFIADGLQRAGRIAPGETINVRWSYEGYPMLASSTKFLGATVDRLGAAEGSIEC